MDASELVWRIGDSHLVRAMMEACQVIEDILIKFVACKKSRKSK